MSHLIEFAVACLLVWLAHSTVYPWAPCLGCRGRRGRGPGSTPAAWNKCPMCGGSGERLRLLAHVTRRDLAKKQKERKGSARSRNGKG